MQTPKLVPGWRRIAVAGALSLGLATTAHAATAVPLDIPGAGRSADIDEAYGFDGGLLGGGWRHQRSYGYQGPAGVYSCEQGQIGSNLNRKACGGQKFPNRFF